MNFCSVLNGPQPLPSNKAKKKIAVCKRRMADKHKEHKHHKLVGYWTRVVVFELLCLLWTTLKTTLLCFHWTALKTLLTSHSRKIANIIRRGVIYIFLLICVSLLNSSCGHWTVCFYWTMHTKSKTNLNSTEDATREPHVKVLQVIYHWSVHLSYCSKYEDDRPQPKCIVYKESSE